MFLSISVFRLETVQQQNTEGLSNIKVLFNKRAKTPFTCKKGKMITRATLRKANQGKS